MVRALPRDMLFGDGHTAGFYHVPRSSQNHVIGRCLAMHPSHDIGSFYVRVAVNGTTSTHRGSAASARAIGCARVGGRPRRFGAAHGDRGTWQHLRSGIGQRWVVSPAAMAGGRSGHCQGAPAGARRRRRSCHQQQFSGQPTSHLPALSTVSVGASARPRRAKGAEEARQVAVSRSLSAVSLTGPRWLAARTVALAASVPRTTRRAPLAPRRCPDRLTRWPRSTPAARTTRGRPRRPGRSGCRPTRRTAVTARASPAPHTRGAWLRPQVRSSGTTGVRRARSRGGLRTPPSPRRDGPARAVATHARRPPSRTHRAAAWTCGRAAGPGWTTGRWPGWPWWPARRRRRRRWPAWARRGAAGSRRGSPPPWRCAAESKGGLGWPRRSGPRAYRESVGRCGEARAWALAPAVPWQGPGGYGSMASAGASAAASGRDGALAGTTRPAGGPKDPRVFKGSATSPRLAGVVP